MKSLKISLSLSLGVFALSLFNLPAANATGVGAGGGGNLVVCFTKPETVTEIIETYKGAIQDKHLVDGSVESIDAYEIYQAARPHGYAAQPGKIHPEFLKSGLWGIDEYYRKVFYPIDAIITNGQQRFRDYDITWVDSPIEDKTAETGDVTALRNNLVVSSDQKCVLATAVIQEQIAPPQDGYGSGAFYRMTIDGRLFNHKLHSQFSKDILRYHEYAYSFARDNGATDSQNITRFIALSVSESDQVSVEDLIEAYRVAKLPEAYLKFTNSAELGQSMGEYELDSSCSYPFGREKSVEPDLTSFKQDLTNKANLLKGKQKAVVLSLIDTWSKACTYFNDPAKCGTATDEFEGKLKEMNLYYGWFPNNVGPRLQFQQWSEKRRQELASHFREPLQSFIDKWVNQTPNLKNPKFAGENIASMLKGAAREGAEICMSDSSTQNQKLSDFIIKTRDAWAKGLPVIDQDQIPFIKNQNTP